MGVTAVSQDQVNRMAQAMQTPAAPGQVPQQPGPMWRAAQQPPQQVSQQMQQAPQPPQAPPPQQQAGPPPPPRNLWEPKPAMQRTGYQAPQQAGRPATITPQNIVPSMVQGKRPQGETPLPAPQAAPQPQMAPQRNLWEPQAPYVKPQAPAPAYNFDPSTLRLPF